MNTLHLQTKKSVEVQPRERAPTVETHHYRELPSLRVETKDVLKQLDSNIRLLEDLGGRLSYMLAEVDSLIRR